MEELVLHVPVNARAPAFDMGSTCPWLLFPTGQWLLQPVPHGIRIARLALCGRHSAARPAAAMPRDLLLMQASQLQNIQRLDLWDAQCPDFPPMPRLTCLTLSFEAVTAHAMLPLPNLTVLEVLVIQGIGSCPSLSCLSRLTRNSLSANHLSGSTMYPVSADVLQSIKVCNACSAMSVCTDAFA